MLQRRSQTGVTLIELLISIAVLTIVMGGIYGLLGSAYQSYMDTRRRIVAQQSARIVLDYLTYRLREVEGGNRPENPWACTEQCHKIVAVGDDATAGDRIPCPMNVTSPRKTHYLTLTDDRSHLRDLNQVAHFSEAYQQVFGAAFNKANLFGTEMAFRADLLPLTGFSETFTDSPSYNTEGWSNNAWNWVAGDKAKGDLNENSVYDPGETELLDDMNENSRHDSFAETWGILLRNSSTDNFYELVEKVDFSSLSDPDPATTKLEYNRSIYPDAGYDYDDNVVIADGIVGYRVEIVPMVAPAQIAAYGAGQRVDNLCASSQYKCHGDLTDPLSASLIDHPAVPTGVTISQPRIYGTNTQIDGFNMTTFLATHPWWNVKGIRVEVTTAASRGGRTRFMTLAEFVIPRNIEVNKVK